MTNPAVRLGDICSGHDGAPPRKCVEASPDVFIEGLGAHRQGDLWAVHVGHDGRLAKGSDTVFINGKPAARVGDMITCGSIAATGAGTVFIG